MKIAEGWLKILNSEFEKEYMLNLKSFLSEEYSKRKIYPHKENIFRALELTDFPDVKVVILGQDPYHGPLQANGLAFAVSKKLKKPPSLNNIFKEVKANFGENPVSPTLEGWAQQGVLLLNTVLTVRAGEANSHRGKGWEAFTSRIIKLLNKREEPCAFMLWGASAQSKEYLLSDKHLVLKAPHPSPLSAYRGFFGSEHFIAANNWLKNNNKEPINWLQTGSLND